MRNIIVLMLLVSIFLMSCKTKEQVKTETTKVEKKEVQNLNKPLMKAITIRGILKQQGITTYQYGSHTVVENGKLYALKSTDVKLDDYVGKNVKLIVVKVPGYPVDGGPDFFKVLRIEIIE